MRPLLALSLLMVSCAGSVERSADSAHVEFDLSWHQDTEQRDIVQCHYLKTPNLDGAEIDRITVDFPIGGHHVHIYRSQTPEEDGIKDCTAGIDWNRWSLLVGVQTKPLDWQLPNGITVPLRAHEQLLVQVHWLNLSGQPIDRTIHVKMHKADRSAAHLGVAFGVSKDVFMRPRQEKRLGNWVPMPENAQLVAMMGHFHGRGDGYRVDLRRKGEPAGTIVYQAEDEQTFEFKDYSLGGAALPVVGAGQGLAYECDFINNTDESITWGPDTTRQEHCNLAAYYYPADETASSVVVSGDLDRVDPLPATLFPGQTASSTVWLKDAAGSMPVEVAIDTADPTIMAPFTVRVPAWSRSAPFQVTGKRPGPLELRVTTGAGVLERSAVVAGLALSEVYYRPADAAAAEQWVELANMGDEPIDLSHFSLGAGSTGYGVTRVALGHQILPPAGCLLVGDARHLLPADPGSLLFVQEAALVPGLSDGAVAAAGVALFDAPADQVAADALPFDAVVYGAANLHGLPAAGGGAAVPVPPSALGGSLERTAAGWKPQRTPTPGICRMPHAP